MSLPIQNREVKHASGGTSLFLLSLYRITVEKQKEKNDGKKVFLFIQFVITRLLWILEKKTEKKEKKKRNNRKNTWRKHH